MLCHVETREGSSGSPQPLKFSTSFLIGKLPSRSVLERNDADGIRAIPTSLPCCLMTSVKEKSTQVSDMGLEMVAPPALKPWGRLSYSIDSRFHRPWILAAPKSFCLTCHTKMAPPQCSILDDNSERLLSRADSTISERGTL